MLLSMEPVRLVVCVEMVVDAAAMLLFTAALLALPRAVLPLQIMMMEDKV